MSLNSFSITFMNHASGYDGSLFQRDSPMLWARLSVWAFRIDSEIRFLVSPGSGFPLHQILTKPLLMRSLCNWLALAIRASVSLVRPLFQISPLPIAILCFSRLCLSIAFRPEMRSLQYGQTYVSPQLCFLGIFAVNAPRHCFEQNRPEPYEPSCSLPQFSQMRFSILAVRAGFEPADPKRIDSLARSWFKPGSPI